MHHRRWKSPVAVALTAGLLFSGAFAGELEPAGLRGVAVGEQAGTFSARTIVAALQIDRDGMQLVSYTLKDRPFVRPLAIPEPRALAEGRSVQAEVILHGPDDLRYTQRVEAGRLCLMHGFGTAPHVQGDTILLHRDAFIVELPELAGFDRIELAYYDGDRAGPVRRELGVDVFDGPRFAAAAGPYAYSDLAISNESHSDTPAGAAQNDLLWPEDFADSDIYRVEGSEIEADPRINVVVVPDGYRFADKATMDSHFDAMVAEFRSFTPYKEHDKFLNYTLIYAYSAESGTDQCDCSDIRNTAMATGFPQSVPICGDSENRCLYYTGWCEPAAVSNIIAAELRAPAVDASIIMVNTTRYGGCGGARAVYSAGNAAATQVAVHELGHSLGGLADEYVSSTGCGVTAGNVNTSKNATEGAWPEWIADLGAPSEGAQYWSECIYRPLPNCQMRSINQPFCPVCSQRWALTYFSHPRVSPTAPLTSKSPGSAVQLEPNVAQLFEITTRVAEGPQVTNDITWWIEGPGFPSPTVVATDTLSHLRSFPQEGVYDLTVEVTADTNFIKPSENASNVDTTGWLIFVSTIFPPPEISPPGSLTPLFFQNNTTVWWEESSGLGAQSYNLYRGVLTELPGGNYGDCLQSGLPLFPSTTVADHPPTGLCWTYLISGVNTGGEGWLGFDSEDGPRQPAAACP